MHKRRGKIALIQGASRGIGLAMVQQLLGRDPENRVFASCRKPASAVSLAAVAQAHPERLTVLSLDVGDERSIEQAAFLFAKQAPCADLIVNVAGLLHGPDFYPEKKLEYVEPKALRKVFEVNAFGPLLVAKHFHRFRKLLTPARSASSLLRVIDRLQPQHTGRVFDFRGEEIPP